MPSDRYADDGLVERKSPLGYTEYVVPDSVRGRYLSPATMAVTHGNTVYYGANVADDPVTQAHERMHVGQNQIADPGTDAVARALSPFTKTWGDSDHGREYSYEEPAYDFSNPIDPVKSPPRSAEVAGAQQRAYNNYINLLYGTSHGNSHHVEAAAPERLERRYIETVPRPMLPPGPVMKERSLLDALGIKKDQ